MTTVADLERLVALIDRLLPLTTKRRGELIEAEDWNTMVGALIEIGRVALAGGAQAEVPDHEHPDQVEVSWLDPRLRELVTGGAEPTTQIDLLKLRRDLTAVTTRMDRTDADLESVRLRVTDVATKVVQRESDLVRLDRKVLGADDSRADITDLRGSLQSIRDQVDIAVRVGSQLEADGQPIDVPGLQARIGEVEKLRDRLTRADGTMVDAAAFDQTVAELRTSLVTQDALTEAIGELRDDVIDRGPVIDREALLGAARVEGTRAAETSVDNLSGQLKAELAAGLGRIEPAVNSAVERATTSLSDDLRSSVLADVERQVSGARESLRDEIAGAFEGRLDGISASFAERLEGLSASLTAQVSAQVDREVPQLLAGVGTRLDKLEGTVQDLDRRTLLLDTRVIDDRTRLEEGLRSEARSRSELGSQLGGRVDAVEAGVAPQVAGQVDAARAILRTELQSSVDAARRDLGNALAETARTQAATEVKVLSTAIRTDVQSVIRQEIDASMKSLRGDIASEVANLQLRISGLVADEVTRVAAEIPERVRVEFENFRPQVERMVTEGINRSGVVEPGPVITRPDVVVNPTRPSPFG